MDGRAGEIAAVHLGVAGTGVVRDDVVGQEQAGSGWCGDLPALVLVMVFTEQHGLLARVLNGVVFSNHVGRSVNPEAVPAADWPDGVAMQFNNGTADTDTRAFGSAGDDVAFCIHLGAVVSGQTGTFCGGDVVVGHLERVLDVTGGLQGVGVDGVALDVHVGVGETA